MNVMFDPILGMIRQGDGGGGGGGGATGVPVVAVGDPDPETGTIQVRPVDPATGEWAGPAVAAYYTWEAPNE